MEQTNSSSVGEGWWDLQPAFFQLLRIQLLLVLEKSTGKATALTWYKWWNVLLCRVIRVPKQVFPLHWHLWPLLQILWQLVTGPESLLILLFENEEKEKPTDLGKPPRENLLWWQRGLWKFWRKVLTVRAVHVLQNWTHEKNQNGKESGDFKELLKQLFHATRFVFIRLVVKLCSIPAKAIPSLLLWWKS